MIGNLHVYENKHDNLHIIHPKYKDIVFLIRKGWKEELYYYMNFGGFESLQDLDEDLFYCGFVDCKYSDDLKCEEYNLEKSNRFKINENGDVEIKQNTIKLKELNIEDIKSKLKNHFIKFIE